MPSFGPQEWPFERSERVTGIAHCASLLERGRSTTELHPRAILPTTSVIGRTVRAGDRNRTLRLPLGKGALYY
ncbi:hypothetical protein GCM10010357_02100 [Streptomyces luteireticuli]|uniref:Uncharacterized protein n=1 Tax=Streptomyces luteireticuli TaxID=173858 RepID=A0ABN0Y6D3_9ACTN